MAQWPQGPCFDDLRHAALEVDLGAHEDLERDRLRPELALDAKAQHVVRVAACCARRCTLSVWAMMRGSKRRITSRSTRASSPQVVLRGGTAGERRHAVVDDRAAQQRVALEVDAGLRGVEQPVEVAQHVVAQPLQRGRAVLARLGGPARLVVDQAIEQRRVEPVARERFSHRLRRRVRSAAGSRPRPASAPARWCRVRPRGTSSSAISAWSVVSMRWPTPCQAPPGCSRQSVARARRSALSVSRSVPG